MKNEKKMSMEYVFVTPELATEILQKNGHNRKLSKSTVQAYANDIINDNWDEEVGSAISIDSDGILRDGQHRLAAVILANKGIYSWICRNVSSVGLYDNNRKRTNTDQIAIMRADLEAVYRTTRYISVAKSIIGHNTFAKNSRRRVTAKEIIDFTDAHKKVLDEFFLKIPQTTVPKISLAVVYLSLFMAYVCGVKMQDILNFYDVLCSGMSTKPEEFPIIAYRNYLKDAQKVSTTVTEISRCQYALKKFITKSCIKRSQVAKELMWGFPFEDEI